MLREGAVLAVRREGVSRNYREVSVNEPAPLRARTYAHDRFLNPELIGVATVASASDKKESGPREPSAIGSESHRVRVTA